MHRVVVLGLLLVAPLVHAQSGDDRARAKEHSRRGTAEYSRGDYAAAITDYEAAYRLSGHPELLFNLAQAQRLHGERARAIESYRKYLELAPSGRGAPEARERIAELLRASYQPGATPRATPPAPTAAPPPAPVAEAAPAPAPPAAVVVSSPASEPARARPLVKRPWFWVVIVGAAAVAGAAVAVGVVYGTPPPAAPPMPTLGGIPGN